MDISKMRPAYLPDPAKRHNLRVAMGLTRTQLAAQIGVSESSIAAWEADRREPRGLQRAAYSAALEEIEDYLDDQTDDDTGEGVPF